MEKFLHLVLSGYVVLLFLDVLRSHYHYERHKFSLLNPTKTWFDFFIDEHKWTIGTLVVTLLLGLIFV